jgi:hypothetical protein
VVAVAVPAPEPAGRAQVREGLVRVPVAHRVLVPVRVRLVAAQLVEFQAQRQQ